MRALILVALAVLMVHRPDGPPPAPTDRVLTDGGDERPRLGPMIRIAALVGRVARSWSADRLRELGVDVVELDDDPGATSAALARALADHDVVYYDGHSFDGRIRLPRAPGYRILVLDACWSFQLYDLPGVDLVADDARSVTGSVGSFAAMVRDLRARRSWREILADMNRAADARATERAAAGVDSWLRPPERYGLVRPRPRT